MNFFIRLIVAIALLTAAGPGTVGDEVSAQHALAGLVVDYGDGRLSYAVVELEDSSISGIELLRKSGVELVTLDFGGLGEGVCSIEEHGCSVGSCRRLCQTSQADSPFWQYFRFSEGSWAPMSMGASSTEVDGGTIDGWSWTGGAPDLPAVDLGELVMLATDDTGLRENEGADFRTYDESGNLVGREDTHVSWWTYAGAGLLLIVAGIGTIFFLSDRGRIPLEAE